jgi:hypothetical protein
MDSKTKIRMKNLILPLAFVFLWACGGKDSAMDSDYTQFKLEDTASIQKISINNNGGSKVILIRAQGGWEIEGLNLPARRDLIEVTLSTLRRMEVKEFIPKNGQQEVFKKLSVYGTRVEVYGTDSEPLRTFFVGGPTQNHLGTYMMLKGSEVPVVVYVPGFRGYLTNHFNPNVIEWKTKQIFNHHVRDIAWVQVVHHQRPESSFRIEVLSPSRLSLIHLQTGIASAKADTSLLKVFLQNFKVLGFENWVDVNAVRLDSVQQKYPLQTITLKDRNGKETSVKLCGIPLPKGTLNMLGEPISVDVDRMYGILKNGEVTLCQFFTFDPVTVPLEYFQGERVGKP